jgi:hypothetical protein
MIGAAIERLSALPTAAVTPDNHASTSALRRQLEELSNLPETKIRVIAIVLSVALLLFIVELVRRRRLKEEYSVLWVTTALVVLALALSGGLLERLTHAIGAISEASTLFFFGIVFVVFLLLHFSVRVSKLERRLTATIQEVALLGERAGPPAPHVADRAAEQQGGQGNEQVTGQVTGGAPAVEQEKRA